MHCRPEHDPRPGTGIEWVDNPLSNFFAWASLKFVPGWCQTETHWTSRLAQNLFTDCPCCLLFRGIAIGLVVGTVSSALVFLVACAALASDR
jgi:hypothetical protein